jgi:hypothetical protein
MKEVIIRYNDSRVLTLLKALSRFFNFSVSEANQADVPKKKITFTVLHVDGQGYKFNREEANER